MHIQRKAKVLVVDGEPNILMSLEFLMRKSGYEVFIARDGAEALQLVHEQRPNVLVLDAMMPEADGYKVCRLIKANPDLKQTRVIFLSAKNKESDIEKGYAAGADLYLTKPFSTKELVKRIQEFLP
ncbi:PleD family two-component system response regulator [Cesiribacter sp. SM1]|uniref:response regulator n=1 Tax=Cesiribacter sp. SM1 TaxID=2861196 RepID=UPI001CD28F1B|nr:response regulator [Cesiribacter sp. SM1]